MTFFDPDNEFTRRSEIIDLNNQDYRYMYAADSVQNSAQSQVIPVQDWSNYTYAHATDSAQPWTNITYATDNSAYPYVTDSAQHSTAAIAVAGTYKNYSTNTPEYTNYHVYPYRSGIPARPLPIALVIPESPTASPSSSVSSSEKATARDSPSPSVSSSEKEKKVDAVEELVI